MFIIELTYKRPLKEVDQLMQAHRDFLDRCYTKKIFLVSGPKCPRRGGIILAVGARNELNKIIEEDPFFKQGMADYRLIEFEPSKYDDRLRDLF